MINSTLSCGEPGDVGSTVKPAGLRTHGLPQSDLELDESTTASITCLSGPSRSGHTVESVEADDFEIAVGACMKD
jgi:hypothetical protein